MLVVAVAIVAAVPASLQSNVIGIHSNEFRFVNLAVCPDISSVAIDSLFNDVVFVDI